MRLKFYHILLSCGLLLVASGNSNLIAAETGHQVINPHWTGKYCEECHLDKKPQKHNAPLKFGGDPIQLCNRCHTRAFVTVEIHPFNVPLTDEMKKHSPPKIKKQTMNEYILRMVLVLLIDVNKSSL